MNNDNIDIDWRLLNMINLDYDLDNDLDDDIFITTAEWNRLNMIYLDTRDPYLNLSPEHHNDALRNVSKMRNTCIDCWLVLNNGSCNI